MIVGNGLLARTFASHFAGDPSVIVFASGVSNSRETRADQFKREHQLLAAALAEKKTLVYFSTCSVDDPELAQSPYVQHKRAMEQMVFEGARQRHIFRLPQVVGACANPHTLTNYLHRQIVSGARFQVWLHARRNLIDADDVAVIAAHIIKNHPADSSTNIACPSSVSILELVRMFEIALDRKANYDTVDAGAGYTIDTRLAEVAATACGIVFEDDYVNNLIRKYYVKPV
jgi:nucleoside-diphosphate-sugar epimerase